MRAVRMNSIRNTSTAQGHGQQKPFIMQSHLKLTGDPVAVEKVRVAKHNYGLLYGAVAGLAFAVTVWGIDDYSLSQAHALFPWLKFIVGAIICVLVGALVGRLSAQFEKVYATFLTWDTFSVAIPLDCLHRADGTFRNLD